MTELIVQATYPDAELLTMSIHDLLRTDGGMDDLTIDTFLRSGWTPPLVLVNRIGGSPDQWDVTDYPIVRVAYYAEKRMDAWNLAAQGEGVMLAHRGRSIFVPEYDREILIDSVELVVGGQQLPDTDPDDRRVVKDYLLGLRRPKAVA